MKKTLGVVAAATLAAMPVMGVFAEDFRGPLTDTIDVSITDACVFARGATAHVDGDGTTARGTWGSEATADLLSGTLAAGEYDADYGSSNFNVVCNHKAGWKVTATATALKGKTTTTEEIPLGTPSADVKGWNYTSSSSDSDATTAFVAEYFKAHTAASNEVVAQSTVTTPTAGRNFTVKYAVAVDHQLSAQTYEGTIAYTLAEL